MHKHGARADTQFAGGWKVSWEMRFKKECNQKSQVAHSRLPLSLARVHTHSGQMQRTARWRTAVVMLRTWHYAWRR